VSIDILRGVMDAERDFTDARYAPMAETSWQTARGQKLAHLLHERGVPTWFGELPPGL
jgi:hypothetical protein